MLTCILSIGLFAKYGAMAVYRGPSKGIWERRLGGGQLLQLRARKYRASQRIENSGALVLWVITYEDGDERVCLVWVILVPEACLMWWPCERNIACFSPKYFFFYLSIYKETKKFKNTSVEITSVRGRQCVFLALPKFNSYSGTHAKSWVPRIRQATIFLVFIHFCSDLFSDLSCPLMLKLAEVHPFSGC